MRKLVALIAGVAVLAVVNFGIHQREQLLTHGRIVLLELAPVDPRSLMQGDYMRLDFALANQAFPFDRRQPQADGRIVAALDKHGVGRFRRFFDGRPLAPDEIALRYRVRNGQPNFATNAYFFEEGQAKTYEPAAYGEFRVGADGEMILTGLRDARFGALGASR
ncbi:GDYXXLXY domain-containing protein [Sphingomonas colocasiae]|uniref:GDYXXLXY domain-containing protein n=1 Tax=Sphingomonas colocasiae TaxID=1848973 RepID=A0ABS7PWF5_9SPHN|nr:GDYXXLXY domain-containing protein [Sphingomonas colocasiae]MBY8825289.1 GDYXXLXY domain-containing protein [Sphingomonas colocasiae]